MSWIYLVIAGLLEIGWPVGLKLAQAPATRWTGIALAVGFMAASGFMLWLAQREIPLGTAYAVWTGIGVAGAATLGVVLLGEAVTPGRIFFLAMLLVAVIGLKMTSGH